MKKFATAAPAGSPSLSLLALEPGRALLDYLTTHLPGLSSAHGDGHSVIVYPGLGAGPWSTSRLRRELNDRGFDAEDWGFGQNHGARGSVESWVAQLSEAVEGVYRTSGRKVSLVGWSLGGIYAREIARAVPQFVRQVITLGSPFAAKPSETNAGWLYGLLNGSPPPATHVAELKKSLRVPSTSIYSKSDGVVPWRGCLQSRGSHAENIEMSGVSHLGMGMNRQVLRLVAERLAQPEGAWRRHRRT